MKIAYFAATHIPSRTAYSVHVMKMASALARAGHDVTLFGFTGLEEFGDPFNHYGVMRGFRLDLSRTVPIPGLRTVRHGIRIAARTGRVSHYDLLYSRHVLPLLCSATTRVPMIYEAHAPPIGRLQRALERRLLRCSNLSHVVVISEALAAMYRKYIPDVGSRIVVAHDAADPPVGGPASPVRPDSVRRLQVGYVGSLYRGRGIELIMQLAAHNSGMDFHIVGGAAQDVAGARARANGSNVTWHGHVPHAAVGPRLAGFDVVLAPYQRAVAVAGNKGNTAGYMSPLKIFEYMAHRKAIIASDLPPLREILTSGRNAILIAPEDTRGWATALQRLAADAALRRALAAAAHEDFMRLYTWDGRARAVLHAPSCAA
jgi:glycosyltransferase involved in cell wall biosynthesis